MGFFSWLNRVLSQASFRSRSPRRRFDPNTGQPIWREAELRWEADACRAYAERGGNAALFVVARRLRLKRRRLAHLLWHRKPLYHSFEIPKRNGATRRIDVPCASLKFVQRQILRRFLRRIPLHRYVHGFRRNHGILSNARPHVGQQVVVNLDLKDFFPSITFGRVVGLFRSLGYDRQQSIIFAKLTTYQDRLPQGAPTSPAISNAVCRRLDRRLAGLAGKFNAAYTRYADDLTFSGAGSILGLLPLIRQIIAEEGFRIADHKLHIARRGRRQKVTGLTVNDRVSVPRLRRRLVRAMVHNAVRDGLKATNRIGHSDYWAYLIGQILFIRQTHPDQGDRLLAAMARVKW